MSRAKLNIWLRYADCNLITDCWRTDLVIKTCGGMPLVDMDPTIVEQLRERYPDYANVLVHDYQGERRIMLYPGGGRHLFHVEVDVPPGCYVVWTRICYGRNEETNKVMVVVGCGDEACVSLLLDDVRTCSKQLLHPLLERGALANLPRRELQVAAGVLMAVAEMPKKQVLAELGERLEHVELRRDPRLREVTGSIMDMVKGLPD
jgi:hypothetical protein